MSDESYRSYPYFRCLCDWHLELGMLRDLLDHIFSELGDGAGPDWLSSSSHIALHRLDFLLNSFPFPEPHQINP